MENGLDLSECSFKQSRTLCHYCCCLWCRKVNERLKNQIDRFWHTTNIYMNSPLHEYAQKLTAKLPENLSVSSKREPIILCLQPLHCCIVGGYIHKLDFLQATSFEGERAASYIILGYAIMQVVYFTNSGGEANELAMMMSRLHTGAFDIVTLR